MEGSAAPTAGIDGKQAEEVAACLRKMQCLPGSVMDHGPALRGLAAIGRGKAPAAGDAPSAMSLVELEAALRDAGSALLEQAGLLAGQHERGGVCAALEYLSFRCFCAVNVLHQAVSGASVDAVPGGEALWGAIVGAWGSVRTGVNVEGALADLTRWWQGFEGADVDVAAASQSGPTIHDAGGEAAMGAALASMRQQAEWLRGEAAGDLRSESAAKHLESAAQAAEEVRELLGCAPLISGRKLKAVGGLDLSVGLEYRNGAAASVYLVDSSIVPDADSETWHVEEWARLSGVGTKTLALCMDNVKRAEAVRIAQGLPRIVQTPHMVAMMHSCAASRADEPLGERSSVTVQVQCEAGWPLRAFVEDEAWGDVGLEVKQRVAVSVLGVCAAAEACGVDVSGVGVGSFVVVGVGSGSLGNLVSAVDGGGCEVVLSACGGVWGKPRTGGSSADTQGGGVLGVLHEVLGVGGGAIGGGSSVVSSYVGSSEGGEHALSSALEALAEGEIGCCMVAFTMACWKIGGDARRLIDAEHGSRAWKERSVTAHNARALEPQTCDQGSDADAAFIRACRDGHMSIVDNLLGLAGAKAIDVHASNSKGPEAAFRGACAFGRTDIVRRLLSLTGTRSIDVHASNRTGPEAAFRAACNGGHTDIVRELLALTGVREVDVHASDDKGAEAAFRVSCAIGQIDIMRELLALTGARAVDVHAEDEFGPEAAFRAACRGGQKLIVRELLGLTGARAVDVHAADGSGREAAFRGACANGHTDIVRELLALTGAREVDVHAADRYGSEAAFRKACTNGRTDIVRELLALTGAREVDVHAPNRKGPDGAFRAACANGHSDIVCELLSLTDHRRIPDSERQRAAKFESLKDLI